MSEQKLNVSAREMVEDRIRSGIAVGDFLPGEPLREREICELTGVSRSAVREAFRSLEAEGLITTVRYRGPMVSQLSIEEVHSIYELRGILESACAQLFTQRATAEQRASLRESVEEIGRGHATQNMVLVINASEKFYQVLTEGTGNVAIGQTLFSLLNRLALFRFSSTRWPGRAEKAWPNCGPLSRPSRRMTPTPPHCAPSSTPWPPARLRFWSSKSANAAHRPADVAAQGKPPEHKGRSSGRFTALCNASFLPVENAAIPHVSACNWLFLRLIYPLIGRLNI
ncbi:GntR family transcriptional regulator [Rouxiella chamberiensis]|uniref:GntR family transcriptional regulator n=1 Tax=Rouxiella chamberiensis TaxID=1513468 RepID=A0ABY7HQW8_9GAMM|nr:GntR family transcriptional regulator [Rouxiella chamberiensis]WAT01422.1 GntR family transcriptional regulator [Rouxiella chamberiensis]